MKIVAGKLLLIAAWSGKDFGNSRPDFVAWLGLTVEGSNRAGKTAIGVFQQTHPPILHPEFLRVKTRPSGLFGHHQQFSKDLSKSGDPARKDWPPRRDRL